MKNNNAWIFIYHYRPGKITQNDNKQCSDAYKMGRDGQGSSFAGYPAILKTGYRIS